MIGASIDATASGDLPPGTPLGPDTILDSLGTGGMGEVYRAKDTRLDRVAAVKGLPALRAADRRARARFEREARAVVSLSHPAPTPQLNDVLHQCAQANTLITKTVRRSGRYMGNDKADAESAMV